MWDNPREILAYRTLLLWRLLWQQRQPLDLQLLGEKGNMRGSDGPWWPCRHPSAGSAGDMPSIP